MLCGRYDDALEDVRECLNAAQSKQVRRVHEVAVQRLAVNVEVKREVEPSGCIPNFLDLKALKFSAKLALGDSREVLKYEH